jgi:phenylacetate-CoA ligase
MGGRAVSATRPLWKAGIPMEMKPEQLAAIREQFKTLKGRSLFYAKKYADVDLADVRTQADFEQLPFTEKADLREAYPLGLSAVPEDKIVRIHSSSGTTGTPVIVPYTQRDVDDWATMFARCFATAGVTPRDRVQITTGYGLWTAGIGFQAGVEKLGAMAVPMGPGNTEKQLKFMEDMQPTVLCATSSYALLLAEEIEKRGIRDQLALRKGIIGSERWGEKMRSRIKNELGIQIYDIYGLTEIYGPGIGISCDYDCGMHYWDDFIYLEILDPETLKPVPDGEYGEICITTLRKEGAPLIRFRTHDISRIVPGECACGSRFPRIDTLVGRSDDMMKIKGVNVFPKQIEEVLQTFPELSSEYQIHISHLEGRDTMRIYVETTGEYDFLDVADRVAHEVKSRIGFTPLVKVVELGVLPRSEKKTKRVFDERYE